MRIGNTSRKIYNSKTKAGLCKNSDCMEKRKYCSAYCDKCLKCYEEKDHIKIK